MKVRLDPYDPSWPKLFEEEQRLLLAAGEPALRRVDHVGSTSVPGLSSKPVIDILGGVDDLDGVASITDALRQVGYEYVPEYEDEIPDRRYFRKGERPYRLAHLHVFEIENPRWEEMILFRDYLRAHKKEAASYAALKRDLAKRYERADYTEAKRRYVLGVVEKARAGELGRWPRGETVVLREIHGGEIWAARPVIVVEDNEERLVLWTPPGTIWKLPYSPDGRKLRLPEDKWELRDHEFTEGMLRLREPGCSHSLILFWNESEFEYWYVNLEEPMRRTGVGFDYLDNKLDLILYLDGSWKWKDEDELEESVARGLLRGGQARAIRKEGEEALERFRSGASPFDEGWEKWTPDPQWQIPALPAGWNKMQDDPRVPNTQASIHLIH